METTVNEKLNTSSNVDLPRQDWLSGKLEQAVVGLGATIDVQTNTRGGTPVLRNTRMPVSRILAELADGLSVSQIAEDFDLEAAAITAMIGAFSIYFECAIPNNRVLTR